jgi:hypothetical protein
MAKDLVFYFAISVLSGIVFLLLHALAVRARQGQKLLATINGTIMLSAIIGASIGWTCLADVFSSEGAKAVACVGGALTFIGFAGVYNLLGPVSVDRSVSVHIVSLLHRAPRHRMTETELFTLYTHDDMLKKRFRDCIDTGIIVQEGEFLQLTPKGDRIARIYAAIGGLLGMRLWFLGRVPP